MKKLIYFIVLIICAGFVSCDLDDPLTDLDCDKLLTVVSSETSVEANGENSIILTATLAEDVKANVPVTFLTDYGFFEGSSQKQDFMVTSEGKKAVAHLVVTKVVSDFEVSVNLDDKCQQFISLSSTPALPDFIDFQTDRTTIKADRSEQAMLSVTMYRDLGRGSVSENIRVNFTSSSDSTDVAADHPAFAFSNDGAVTVGLRSATDSIGTVTVTAAVEGTEISKSLDIEFEAQ